MKNKIYKLKDIIFLQQKTSSQNLFFDEINYLELSGIKKFNFSILKNKIDKKSAKWKLISNCILIGRTRPKNRNHNFYIQKNINNNYASSGFTCFFNNSDFVYNKYLWYICNKTKFINYTIRNAIGSTYPVITEKDLLDFRTKLPTLEEQQKIINIIEPNEKLFLKYFNCIRIDNFKNTKIDTQKIININKQI